jgi:rieske iron-sulfur protein
MIAMSNPRISRRVTLGLGISVFATPEGSVAAAIASFPQVGDLLVFAADMHAGNPIDPEELIAGEPPILACAMEPRTGLIRNQSRFGLILLVRLSASHPREAEADIVAFSAICTHAGCTVSGWKQREGQFWCPCHGSLYDPGFGGAVVGGPAPRPLPSLPLRVDGRTLTVAAEFTARIGGSTGRTD